MHYIEQAFCSALFPKLLGVYERELHSVVEEACKLPVDRAIDIGAAEGYYAAGLAFRRPELSVVAFEIDAAARELAEELVRRNGLDRQVTIRKGCAPADLAEVTQKGVSLVVCDCEGAEAQLLDLGSAPGLAQSYILVETHEFVVPGVTETLRRQFTPTHDIEEIWQEPRRREDFPLTDWYIRRMQTIDLLGVMDEARPVRMQWLWMKPRQWQSVQEEVSLVKSC